MKTENHRQVTWKSNRWTTLQLMIVTRDKDSHYAEDHRPPQYQTTSSNTSTLTVVYIDIVSVFLLLSPHILPGASRGFAFVEFSTEEEATRWMNHKQVQETKESITMSMSSSCRLDRERDLFKENA